MNDNRIIIRLRASGVFVLTTKSKGPYVFDHSEIKDGRLSQDVCDRLKAYNAKKKAEVIVILPSRQVIFKYFSLPSKDPNELRRMVELQVGRGLPFSVQEIVYQTAPAGTDAQGLTRVVVAIARQKMVQESLDVITASGLNPSRCALSAFGVAAWHARHFSADADQWVLVIDADSDGFEFCFCNNKQLMFARGIAMAGDPESMDGFTLQTDLTLQAFLHAYPDASLSKVVLTGLEDHWGSIKGILSQKLHVPCQEASSQEIPKDGSSGDDTKDAFRQWSMCSLVGMAYAVNPGPDLMPSSVRQDKHSRSEVLSMLRMFTALVVFCGAVTIWGQQRLGRQEEALRVVRGKIVQTSAEYQQAQRNLKLYEFLLQDRSDKIVIAEIFKELYKALPSSVVLTSVQYSDGNLMVLGQTRESGDVGAFQKSLMGSPLFKDVTLQYANRPQRLAMEYTEFKIVCRVSGKAGGGI